MINGSSRRWVVSSLGILPRFRISRLVRVLRIISPSVLEGLSWGLSWSSRDAVNYWPWLLWGCLARKDWFISEGLLMQGSECREIWSFGRVLAFSSWERHRCWFGRNWLGWTGIHYWVQRMETCTFICCGKHRLCDEESATLWNSFWVFLRSNAFWVL